MSQTSVAVSKEFKNMTIRAILSIAFFIVIYITLICLSLGITILSGYAGIAIIAAHPAYFTILIGAGLISMGLLVLIFLSKFIFTSHKTDRSHLIEIKKKDEPKLFEFIESIVDDVQTNFPKKIYISPDVNASVFYDSSFWSMLLPVKKKLQIGVGLVNSVSELEFKAILAHEFGHFSQSSMKVGSYVYNVNQVIYNLLNENESYQSLANSWAGLHGFIAFFVGLAVKIVEGIQWVLRITYGIVNKSYMALSREMEFHADEVAANTAGSKPLITSLLRLDLADQSYNTVINFYNEKINDSVKTQNIYPQQQYVMNFLAEESKLQVENDLPQVSVEHLGRYNKSKLVIKDQWASHPRTEDRVSRLEQLNIHKQDDTGEPASGLFSNIDELQTRVTNQLFSTVTYTNEIVDKAREQFIEEFNIKYKENSFHPIYDCYYDNKNPTLLDIDSISIDENGTLDIGELFSPEKVDMVYTSIALENDIQALKQISDKKYGIKSFDYDGNRYRRKDCETLIPQLENEMERFIDEINLNDTDIYKYFMKLASGQKQDDALKSLYQSFYYIDKEYEPMFEIYVKMLNAYNFMFQTQPIVLIETNIIELKPVENELKEKLRKMLTEKIYTKEITVEIRDNFTKYVSEALVYFKDVKYDDDALGIMITANTNFQQVLAKTYFRVKKELLEFQSELEKNK